MKKQWTEEIGQGIATISKTYSFVSRIWSSMEIGPEIIPWLETECGTREAEVVLRSLGEKFLAMQSVAEKVIPGQFFMTVTRGLYQDVASLRQGILSSGKKIGKYADQILEKIQISSEKVEIDLWEVSGAELGFTEAVSLNKIYQRAVERGFEIISAEAIALARIKCVDGKLRIGGMEPIEDSGSGCRTLNLSGGNGDLWLRTHYVSPGGLWQPRHVWLFGRLRRK